MINDKNRNTYNPDVDPRTEIKPKRGDESGAATCSARKRLFTEFMKSRVNASLEKACFRLAGKQVDRQMNPLRVGIISEAQFDEISKDVCASIEEYYDDFLTDKLKPNVKLNRP